MSSTRRARICSAPRCRLAVSASRPILMTSLAFIFGVLPMATSTGAEFRQPACGRHRSDGRDDLRHRAGDLFRAAVLCAGASPFSAKGASAINRRASAARRNNRKGDHGGRLLYVFRTLARLFISRYTPAHIAEIYLRSMPSIKSFQFPSSCSIIIASSYYYGRFYITSLPMGSCAPLLL